jgi:AsmA protein
MRWIKRLLLIGLSLVAIIALGLVAVLFWVDPNAYKDDIAHLVRSKTGRELHLAGDLKLDVFPSIAIDVRKATLGNPPGFGAEPFVAVDRARLVMRLWPLLHKRFEVKRVILDGLKLHLVTDKSGHTNWENLGGEESAKEKAGTPSETSGTSATIAGIDIRDSEIVMEDRRDGSTRRLMDLNVKAGELGLGHPVPVDARLNLDSGAGSKATRISFKSPGISADLEAETLAVPEFSFGLGDLQLSGSVTGRKILSERELEGELKLAETSLRGTLEELSGAPLKTRDDQAFTRVGFDTSFALGTHKLELQKLTARLDETELKGSLGIAEFDPLALVFDLKADQMNLDHYRAPEEKEVPGKREKPSELPVEALRKLNARGTLSIGRAVFGGMTFEDITLKLNAADGAVHLGPTQARLYGGNYHGDMNIDARGHDVRLALDEHLRDIDFAKLLAAAYDSKRFSGRGSANIAVAGVGRTSDAITRTLDGNVDFNVNDGALEGHDLWFELRRARALIKQEPAPQGEGAGRTTFKVLKGSGKVVNGTLTTDDLLVETPYLKVAGKGTVALPTQAIDLHFDANIYQVPASGAGSEMADVKTAAAIPVRVTGTLTDYKVRPDLDAALKAELKKKIEEQKEGLKQKLQDKLRDLFGH